MADPTLFICYSHTDRGYREQFSKFLEGLWSGTRC